MEDKFIARTELTADCSVFGVFDGHGGREVSAFVEKHFIAELHSNPNFGLLRFEEALTETFLKMDELMRTPEGQKEVNSFKEAPQERTT
jgi:protein phosphatase 1G